MKKILFVLSILFTIMAFAGAGYVIYNSGKVSAGYAVMPLLFVLICISAHRKK